MKKMLVLFLGIISNCCTAQNSLDSYLGGWSGTFAETDAFLFQINLLKTTENAYYLDFHGRDSITKIKLENRGNQYYGSFNDQLVIKMKLQDKEPIVFLQVGHHLCQVPFEKKDTGLWRGEWNLLLAEGYNPTLYLSLDQEEDQTYNPSTFFKEPSLHYMQCGDFKIEDGNFHFVDIRSRIYFDGVLEDKEIKLSLKFLNESTILSMAPTPYDDWRIGQFDQTILNTVITQETERFDALTNAIKNDTLERTHSVIIAQNDTIIYERYFDGFTKATPHDTRSVAKSFASALVGMAIEQHLLDSENQTIEPSTKTDTLVQIGQKIKILLHYIIY